MNQKHLDFRNDGLFSVRLVNIFPAFLRSLFMPLNLTMYIFVQLMTKKEKKALQIVNFASWSVLLVASLHASRWLEVTATGVSRGPFVFV